jgi:alpha-glucosidase
MPWHADRPAAGFTAGTPWLPVPEEHQALAVDVQATDPASTLAFTRGLLARRRVSADWRSNEAELLELPAPLIGFRRGAGALALFNLSAEAVALPPGLHPGAPARLEAWGFTLLERVAETMAA